MGIKEQYQSLVEAQQKSGDLKKQENYKRKFDYLSKREKEEWLTEWKKQLSLFKKLRELGVIDALEEATGEKLNFVIDQGGVEKIGIKRPWSDKWWSNAGYEEDTDLSEQFSFDTVSPHLNWKTEEWNPNARLLIGRVDDPMYSTRIDAVVISFSPEEVLEIRGKEVTFKDKLPEDETIRKELIDKSIGEALFNPIPDKDVLSTIYPD